MNDDLILGLILLLLIQVVLYKKASSDREKDRILAEQKANLEKERQKQEEQRQEKAKLENIRKTELEKERQKQESQRKKEALQAFHDGPFNRFLGLREQMIKEALPAGNWQLQYQSSSVGQQVDYSCRYDGKKDVNIFKTLAHLQAFLRDRLSDDGNIRCHTCESRSFGWTLFGIYHALHYSAFVTTGLIWLKAWGINQDNPAVLEDLVPRFEDFFIMGHSDAVTDRINPTSIGVETHFSVHDGGYADLGISYESGLTENHDLWDASCYTPPDMQGDGGLLQTGLADYLESIRNLEAYY